MKLLKMLLACAGTAALLSLACGGVGRLGSAPPSKTAAGAHANASPAGANNSNTSGAAEAATGVEKVKPAAGTGNIQGKVLYNGKPVPNIDVKLCEKFNRFFGGCSGKTFAAKSDADGDYVIANVPPMSYEGLTVRVF